MQNVKVGCFMGQHPVRVVQQTMARVLEVIVELCQLMLMIKILAQYLQKDQIGPTNLRLL